MVFIKYLKKSWTIVRGFHRIFLKKSWTIVHGSLVPTLFVLQAIKAVRRPGNEAKFMVFIKLLKKSWTIVHGFHLIHHGVFLFFPSTPATIVHNSSQYLILMQLISKIISHKPGLLSF